MQLTRGTYAMLVLTITVGVTLTTTAQAPPQAPPQANDQPASTPAPAEPTPQTPPQDAGQSAPWTRGLRVGLQGGYFKQVDSGGIAELDEDMSVLHGMIMLELPIGDHVTLSGEGAGDIVSSASMVRAHNRSFRALQSDASGVEHGNAGAAILVKGDDWSVGVGGGADWDYLFISGNGAVHGAIELFEKNTTLGVSLRAFYGVLHMVRFDGRQGPDDSRTTLSPELSWTQVLTPLTLLQTVLSYTHQTGFLANPYNSVFVDGVEAAESLPGERQRVALTMRLKQGFGERHAVELGARGYLDDWGLDALTATVGYSVSIVPHLVLVDLAFRLHVQAPADAWAGSFEADPTRVYQTSDPDLGDFTGHMGTLRATFGDASLSEADGGFGAFYVEANAYRRSSGLDMLWFLIGLQTTL